MAAPWQRLPVRLERAPHRGAAFALSNASKRARTRSISSRSRGPLIIGSRSRGSLFGHCAPFGDIAHTAELALSGPADANQRLGNHTQSFCSRYGSPNTCGQAAVGFDGLLLVAHRRHRQLSYIGDAAQSRQIENRQRAFIGFDQAGAAGTPTALG